MKTNGGTNEGYVALQAWLVGQLNPRAPHAADLFAQDRECLYDAFLSVLVGTGLGFSAYDDNCTHHGLYAFDFFVGDIKVPPRDKGVDVQRAPGMAGESATDAAGRAMCHALVDTWLGETDGRIPYVASVIASVATLELVADVSVDECVFECDLPPEYARFTANKPWEDGSLPIGALDSSLVVPGPLIHLEARPRYKGQALSPSGFTAALASAVQMGLAVESSSAFAFGAAATLRAPRTGALRCSGGPPMQWLEPCPRAVTPGACRSECASSTRRCSAHALAENPHVAGARAQAENAMTAPMRIAKPRPRSHVEERGRGSLLGEGTLTRWSSRRRAERRPSRSPARRGSSRSRTP